MLRNFIDYLTMGVKYLDAVKRRLHATKQWSQTKLGHDRMCYIYLLWCVKLLSLFDLYWLKTWGVRTSGMKVTCMCGMQFIVDVANDDFNRCVVMLIILMI